jgi:hypothetical protein
MPGRRREEERRRLAQAAARVLLEEGPGDYERARRKAAARLGIGDHRRWPGNAEIQDALREQQRLFRPDQAAVLQELRRQALQALHTFARFQPRLVGPVLDGSADATSPVTLHLYADTPEEVAHALLERHIPWVQRDRRLRFGGGQQQSRPLFRFQAGDTRVELLVLTPADLASPPLDPVTEQPRRGAGPQQLERLIHAGDEPPGTP